MTYSKPIDLQRLIGIGLVLVGSAAMMKALGPKCGPLCRTAFTALRRAALTA